MLNDLEYNRSFYNESEKNKEKINNAVSRLINFEQKTIKKYYHLYEYKLTYKDNEIVCHTITYKRYDNVLVEIIIYTIFNEIVFNCIALNGSLKNDIDYLNTIIDYVMEIFYEN